MVYFSLDLVTKTTETCSMLMCNFLSGSPFQTYFETCLGCIHKTSPSIGPDLVCILDEHDDEDVIDPAK